MIESFRLERIHTALIETSLFSTQTPLKNTKVPQKIFISQQKNELCVPNIMDGKTSQNKVPDLITIAS